MAKFILIALILLVSTVANAADTLYYTTSGAEVIYSIPDWVNMNNPKCTEYEKIYDNTYDKLATDGTTCWRYRTWVCATDKQRGVDIEPLPLSFCSKK